MAGFRVDSRGSVEDIPYVGDVRFSPSGPSRGAGREGASGNPPDRPGPPTAAGDRGPLRWVVGLLGLMLAGGLGVLWIMNRDTGSRQREEALSARAGELDRQQATLADQEHRLQ